jgi:hypothetical protein
MTTEGTQVIKKGIRRGISNSTKATGDIKFHEKDAAANGLFVGHLEKVSVDKVEPNEDSKIFTGLPFHRLTFEFQSNQASVSERRHVYHNILPVESNVNTIPGGKEEWKVNSVMKWIKHLLDVFYLKGRELTEAEEDALTLSFVDFDEDGNYIAVEPEDVVAGYKAIFESAAAMLNGEFGIAEGAVAKPTYKSADGKGLPIWMKLLRHRKKNDTWVNVGRNGELAFDGFLSSAAIELVKPNTLPSIVRLDASKESITPKETKKAPSIGGMIGAPGMGGVVADGIAMPSMGDTDAFAAAGENEMPF